jgi:chromosome segregation ATPase
MEDKKPDLFVTCPMCFTIVPVALPEDSRIQQLESDNASLQKALEGSTAGYEAKKIESDNLRSSLFALQMVHEEGNEIIIALKRENASLKEERDVIVAQANRIEIARLQSQVEELKAGDELREAKLKEMFRMTGLHPKVEDWANKITEQELIIQGIEEGSAEWESKSRDLQSQVDLLRDTLIEVLESITPGVPNTAWCAKRILEALAKTEPKP